jgi:hypothetical protein
MPKSILPATTGTFPQFLKFPNLNQEMFCQKTLTRLFSGMTTGLMVGVVPMAAPYELIHPSLMSGAMAQSGIEVTGSQYVVYLSGATAANLRRAKTAVPDAFITTLDNGTRVVQLGRFNNLNLAQRRLSELQSKGLAPQIYTQGGAVTANVVPVAPTPPRATRTTRAVPNNIPAVPSAFIADTPAALPQGNSADTPSTNNAANPFNVPVPPTPPSNTVSNTQTNTQTNTVRGSGTTINRNNTMATTGDNQAIPLPNVPRPVAVNPSQPTTNQTAAQPIPIERTTTPTSPTSIEIVRPSSNSVPQAVAMNPAPVNTPSNRYFVIIPNGSVAELQRVRNFSPNAQVKSSGRGTYIEIQGYPDRLSAETMNSTLLKQRFDSRVVYF